MYEFLRRNRGIAAIRDRVLSKNGVPRLAEGTVCWEGWTFTYAAPYKSFIKAKERGIENRICRLARATLRPGDTGIDIGANYGFVSMVMAKSVMPKGLVLSFEVDPSIAHVLGTTLQKNSLDSVARVIGKGAGAGAADKLVTVDDIVQSQRVGRVRFLKWILTVQTVVYWLAQWVC